MRTVLMLAALTTALWGQLPASVGGVTVLDVVPQPNVVSLFQWDTVQVTVTVQHQAGLSFSIAQACQQSNFPNALTYFGFRPNQNSYELKIELSGVALPGSATSVIQVQVSSPPGLNSCGGTVVPGLHPVNLKIETPTTGIVPLGIVAEVVVTPELVTGESITLGAPPQIGTVVPLNITRTTVNTSTVFYVVGFSLGNSPGIATPFGQTLPLVLDSLLVFSITNSWNCDPALCPPQAIFINTIGAVPPDPSTPISAYIQIPNAPSLVGLTVYAAHVILDQYANVAGVSNSLAISIVN